MSNAIIHLLISLPIINTQWLTFENVSVDRDQTLNEDKNL